MCWLEFDYAWRQEKTIHAVVLDKEMTNPRKWIGILSGNYFSIFVEDPWKMSTGTKTW